MIDITGQFEVQRMALRNMLQDVDGADKIFEDLYRFSSDSTYRFSELAKYAKQLSAFNIDKGSLLETTKMLGDVASGVGVSMDRLILAYGHVKSSGFLRGIQLRSFSQNGVPILDELAAYARERVARAKENISLAELRRMALASPKGSFAFENALKTDDIAFICECKKASPSKGLIAPDFPYLQIALDYEAAGADCISVLTEPKWFLGSNDYLKEIAENVKIPCLRKDFTVDEYMIYEAKLLGASAVLLIAAILSQEQLSEYIDICDGLGLSALVEAHDEAEAIAAINAGARIIGVNNRNLKDFSVDTENSRRLRSMIPASVLFVSESGVRTAEDVQALRDIGADAVLIGETLMKAQDKRQKLTELRGCK